MIGTTQGVWFVLAKAEKKHHKFPTRHDRYYCECECGKLMIRRVDRLYQERCKHKPKPKRKYNDITVIIDGGER